MTSHARSVIILGTSPILLIEGLMRARAQQKVIFIEACDSVGGAWSVADAFGLQDLEAACHLIVNYRGVYRFLSDVCGIALEKQEPIPLLYRNSRFTAFNARRHILRRCSGLAIRTSAVSAIRLLESLSANRWTCSRTKNFRVSETLRSLADHRLYPMEMPAAKRAIRYPIGGSPAMLRILLNQLFRLDATFISGRAEAAALGFDGCARITLADGREYTADELVVSESAALNFVESPNEKQTFDVQATSHPSLFIRLQNVAEKAFSYIELPHDPILERVTDITNYCRGEIAPDNRIVVCEIPKEAEQAEELIKARPLIEYLKALQLLPPEAEPVEETVHQLSLHRGSPALISHLKALTPSLITVVSSRGDFALSIHRNLRRWAQFTSTNKHNDECANALDAQDFEDWFPLATELTLAAIAENRLGLNR